MSNFVFLFKNLKISYIISFFIKIFFRSGVKDQSVWFTTAESVVHDVVTPTKRVNPTKRMLPKKKISTSKSMTTTSPKIIVSYKEDDKDEITTSTTAVALPKEVK